jgi:type II secretion system protein N
MTIKPLPKWVILGGTGFFSFVFFFYMSFPFEILKETVSSQLSSASKMQIEIAELSPRFPLGIRIKGFQIRTQQGSALALNQVDVRVSLLKLFLGKLGLGLALEDAGSGELDLDLSFSLLSFLSDSPIPSYIGLEADQFSLDELVNFFLKGLGQTPGTNVLLKPVLEAFALKGKLSGGVSLYLDATDPGRSSGEGELLVKGAELLIKDPSMPIPNQTFEKASVKIVLKEGNLQLDPSSGLKSHDLDITFGGRITQRPQVTFDLLVGVVLQNKLKDQFGWLLETVGSKGASQGRVDIHVGGNVLDGPTINVL